MLSNGEITKGMLVTVHRWTVKKKGFNPFMGGSHEDYPTKYVGTALLVKGVQIPFIRVEILDEDYRKNSTTLNLNELELMELSTDFLDDPDIISKVRFSSDDHLDSEQMEETIQSSKVVFQNKNNSKTDKDK